MYSSYDFFQLPCLLKLNSRSWRFSLTVWTLAVMASGWSPSSLSAQDAVRSFKAGQQIEWLDGITGKWSAGTFVDATPGGRQPIIQQRPGDVGSQTAYEWEKIRAPQKPVAAPVVGQAMKAGQSILWLDHITNEWTAGEFVGETADGKQPIIRKTFGDFRTQTAYAWNDIRPATTEGVAPFKVPASTSNPNLIPARPTISGTVAPAGKPLTEEEVKQFIIERVGDRPFDDPAKLRQTILELDMLVKNRGTQFLYNTALNDFGNWLGAHGFSAIGPINHNFGPPNDQQWLFGSWVTSKTGLPVHWVEGDLLITWTEIGAANTGIVTINPNGTYRWQTDSAQGDIVGKWRPANVEEMGDQGGAGVILENAKEGVEWVAYKYRASNPDEEWLGLAQVNSRSTREGAIRLPPNKVNQVKVGS